MNSIISIVNIKILYLNGNIKVINNWYIISIASPIDKKINIVGFLNGINFHLVYIIQNKYKR